MITSKFEHVNVIRLLDVFQDDLMIYIIMEFLEGENLYSFIQNHKKELWMLKSIQIEKLISVIAG